MIHDKLKNDKLESILDRTFVITISQELGVNKIVSHIDRELQKSYTFFAVGILLNVFLLAP